MSLANLVLIAFALFISLYTGWLGCRIESEFIVTRRKNTLAPPPPCPKNACPTLPHTPDCFGLGPPSHPERAHQALDQLSAVEVVDSPEPWSSQTPVPSPRWRPQVAGGEGGAGLGRAEAADQETKGEGEGRRGDGVGGGSRAGPRPGSPREGGLCSRPRPGGAVSLGSRKQKALFLARTRGGRWVGQCPPTPPQRRGWGARGALPAAPLPWLCPQAKGLGGGNGGSRAGAGIGGAWHAASAAGAFPPPLPACSPARRAPRQALSPPSVLRRPRAIARPP